MVKSLNEGPWLHILIQFIQFVPLSCDLGFELDPRDLLVTAIVAIDTYRRISDPWTSFTIVLLQESGILNDIYYYCCYYTRTLLSRKLPGQQGIQRRDIYLCISVAYRWNLTLCLSHIITQW